MHISLLVDEFSIYSLPGHQLCMRPQLERKRRGRRTYV